MTQYDNTITFRKKKTFKREDNMHNDFVALVHVYYISDVKMSHHSTQLSNFFSLYRPSGQESKQKCVMPSRMINMAPH